MYIYVCTYNMSFFYYSWKAKQGNKVFIGGGIEGKGGLPEGLDLFQDRKYSKCWRSIHLEIIPKTSKIWLRQVIIYAAKCMLLLLLGVVVVR